MPPTHSLPLPIIALSITESIPGLTSLWVICVLIYFLIKCAWWAHRNTNCWLLRWKRNRHLSWRFVFQSSHRLLHYATPQNCMCFKACWIKHTILSPQVTLIINVYLCIQKQTTCEHATCSPRFFIMYFVPQNASNPACWNPCSWLLTSQLMSLFNMITNAKHKYCLLSITISILCNCFYHARFTETNQAARYWAIHVCPSFTFALLIPQCERNSKITPHSLYQRVHETNNTKSFRAL